jgi:hypothetical protein
MIWLIIFAAIFWSVWTLVKHNQAMREVDERSARQREEYLRASYLQAQRAMLENVLRERDERQARGERPGAWPWLS